MKFGQFIEYNMRIIFFKNHTENEVGRLVPDIFLYFKKDLCEIKTSGQRLIFNIIW